MENGPTSQCSIKNNQYPKELIPTADIMKNHWLDNYGTRKNRAQNIEKRKFQNKTRVKRRKRKIYKNNLKQGLHRKVN